MKISCLIPLLALSGASFASGETKKDAAGAGCCPVAPAVCPVSGEKLGSMGEPHIHLHQESGQPDREVTLCCERCVPRFKKDPATYLSKADAAKAGDCCAAPEAVDRPASS